MPVFHTPAYLGPGLGVTTLGRAAGQPIGRIPKRDPRLTKAEEHADVLRPELEDMGYADHGLRRESWWVRKRYLAVLPCCGCPAWFPIFPRKLITPQQSQLASACPTNTPSAIAEPLPPQPFGQNPSQWPKLTETGKSLPFE